jgi:hypothetical protein
MPIRFYCASCRRPIEVDDEHAGMVATCPYCRQVVPVPAQSTYVPTARPAEGGSEVFEAAAPAARRRQAARTYGTYAIVLGIIAYGLMIATVLLTPPQVREKLASGPPATGPVSRQELARWHEQQVREVLEELRDNPVQPALGCGGLFFAICGLVLGIASLVQVRSGNWRGVVGLGLSLLYLLLQCAGSLYYVMLSRGAG